MTILTPDTDTWIGRALTDGDHRRVGTIEEIYCDERSDEAIWMVVKSGRVSARRAFVPTASTRVARDAVVTVYDKDEIDGAPQIDDVDDVPEEQLRALYRHYGLQYEGGGDLTPAERVMAYLM